MRNSVAICRCVFAMLPVLPAAILGCSARSDAPVRGDLADGATFAAAEDLERRPVNPLSESTDEVVVLTFVRTDCPISNRYAPTLRKLSRRFTPQGARFYLVYPNPDATPDAIHKHLEEYDWGIAALRDPGHALVSRAGATITPEAAVFNRHGKLVYHGRIDDRYVDFGKSRPAPTTHDLEDAITAALADKAVPVPVTEAVGCFIADLK